ncbi:MAG: WD40 repeat domain-containing protein [bacterium]
MGHRLALARTIEPSLVIRNPHPADVNDINCIAFSPDGQWLATGGSNDHMADLWNAETGEHIRAFQGHSDWVLSLAFSSDGRQLLTSAGYHDPTARLWDVETGELIRTYSGQTYALFSVGFAPDGLWFMTASGRYDPTARLWDLDTGEEIRQFATFTDRRDHTSAAALSPDGRWIVTVSDDYLAKLWDTVTGEEIRTLTGHTSQVRCIAFSPDSRWIVTGSGDCTAKLWDRSTGQEIRTFAGHTGAIHSVAFSPDETHILTGCFEDQTAKVWNAYTGEEILTLRGHEEPLLCVTFSPDGRKAATGSRDDTARIWDLDFLDSPPLAETPTATPAPPTPTLTPTPVENISPDWPEFSPGSASEGGITNGKGKPKRRIGLVNDADGNPVIFWDHLPSVPGETLTYVLKWDGASWSELGPGSASGTGVASEGWTGDRMVLDPLDNNLVFSMDFYRNGMFKFDGRDWVTWAGGGIDDSGGLEFSTDVGFLPDQTPIAVYNHSVGPTFSHVRVRKYSDGVWEEFSPGSATGNGISETDFCVGEWVLPQLAVTSSGDVYVLWAQAYDSSRVLYIKRWDGSTWTEIPDGSATGFGFPGELAYITFRALTLDSNEHPIVTYTASDKIYVQRFDGTEWVEMGVGSASGDGLCDPGCSGSDSVIVNDEWDHPIVVWRDYPSGALYAKQFNGTTWEPAGEGAASGNGVGVVLPTGDGRFVYDAILGANGNVVLAYAGGPDWDIYVRNFDPASSGPTQETPTSTPVPPTPTNTPIPTNTRTPTWTPTIAPIYTPVENISPDWPEYSPGSASGGGITNGKGKPKIRVGLVNDADGNPVVFWDHQPYTNSETVVYVLKWDGTSWTELGTGSASGTGVAPEGWTGDRMVIDPSDNKLIFTTNFYRNGMMKFDGGEWNTWASGGIDDDGGLEFFTDLGFLPDNTPVAAYWHAIIPSFANIRVRKYVENSWEEFSPGSVTESGITSPCLEVQNPQLAITSTGRIYVLWRQTYGEDWPVYIKEWDGSSWKEIPSGSATELGLSAAGAQILHRSLVLDSNEYPIVTYGASGTVYVKRFDGTRWVEMGEGSATGDGLCDPGRIGRYPIIVNDSQDHPVVIWRDHPSGAVYAKQFNGTTWEPAGEGAASGNGIGISLLGDGRQICDAIMGVDGKIIVAYAGGNDRDIYIRRYDPDGYKELAQETPTGIPVLPTETPTGTPVPPTPTNTPTRINTPTPTNTRTPTWTPTVTPTPTPIEGISPDWPEYSPGSASGGGITNGKGKPKMRLGLVNDADGNPVVFWDHQPYANSETFVYVLKWNGMSWSELGAGSASGTGVAPISWTGDRMVLDPSDNKLVFSMNYDRNAMIKFDGQAWNSWAGGGIDDRSGFEFFTDIGFLPDNTPVAVYWHGILPSHTRIRVQKFVNGSWVEFSPGSATGTGIGGPSEEVYYPQLAITSTGHVYVLWCQKYRSRLAVYMKEWDGFSWKDVPFGSSTGLGISAGSAQTLYRGLALDSNEYPIVTYTTSFKMSNKIHVKRFDGTRWGEMGVGSASGDGLCDPERSGANPILVNDSQDHPVVIWQDSEAGAFYAKRFNGTVWEPAGEGAASGNGIGIGDVYDAIVGADGEFIFAYAGGSDRDIYIRKFEPETPIGTPTPTRVPSPTPTTIPAWFILDGFGGIHSSNPNVKPPLLPYFLPYNIVRDLEPDPLGRGWYMLDGFGGIHTSSPDLPKPELPYFGFDIARNLEIRQTENGPEFYLLDGYGAVHTSSGEPFQYGNLPYFGVDLARDLEPDPIYHDGWMILDAYSLLHTSARFIYEIPLNDVGGWPPLFRGIVLFPDDTLVLIDAFGGRHTNPLRPARDVVDGLSPSFYFPGFDIIWDVEVVPLPQ